MQSIQQLTKSMPPTSIEKFSQAKVVTVKWGKKGTFGKKLWLQYINEPKSTVTFMVPRSACVTKGDIVYSGSSFTSLTSMEQDYLFVKCKNGFAQLTPIYSEQTFLSIGALTFQVNIKEISQQDEFDGYLSLTHYHYRDKTLFGRHSPLVLTANHPLLPKVLGYIDLTTAFFVNSPRRSIMDAPCRLNGVSWDEWTAKVIKKFIPLFVRIARCVVHPELRSVGLGKLLVEHASEFARTHWQSAHWQPYFLEISADMLRHIPFVEKAGMTFVGETEGNLKRIVRDMTYLRANQERVQKDILTGEICGILDTKLSQLQKANAITINGKNGSKAESIEKFIAQQIKNPTLDGWAKLAGILSLPKPHYLMGLNQEATQLITNRVQTIEIAPSPTKDSQIYLDQIYNARLQQPIKVKNLAYYREFTVTRTQITHQIERAFEISLDNLTQPIFRNLNFEIIPGEIWVVTGLSGTGKTTLLHILANKLLYNEGQIEVPENIKFGLVEPIVVSAPLIEVIGGEDASKGIYWMGIVGLSEPYLYVKPFSALSAGQKYRAMLANLLVKEANLWLIDEFCENLDIINTNLLAEKITSLAKKVGATVVVASSDASRFAKQLKPDKVLVLKGGTDKDGYKILKGNHFLKYLEG